LEVVTNKYLKFIVSFVILIFLVGITDRVIGKILRHLYFKQTSGLYYRTTYAIDSTKADMLIFGSSRANHHYVPEIFEERLNLSFFNTGRDGNFLLFNYAAFKAVINRYTPRIIIFDFNPDEMYYEESDYERLSSLLPYCKKHPEILSIVELKSPFEKYKQISEIYPFNSCLLTIIMGNLETNKNRKGDIKGYVPLTGVIRDTVLHKMYNPEGELDGNKVNSIQDIIQYCNNYNINLFFIQSPIYAQVENTMSTQYLAKVAKENNVIFWNFSNCIDFLSNPMYFQDQKHLNGNGATFFSHLLVMQIDNLMRNRKNVKLNEEELMDSVLSKTDTQYNY
jgi:hypothetical protein